MDAPHGPAYRPRSRPDWAVPRPSAVPSLLRPRSPRPFRARHVLLLVATMAIVALCLRLACGSGASLEPDRLPRLNLEGRTTIAGTVTGLWAAPGGGVVQLDSGEGRLLAAVGADGRTVPLPPGALPAATRGPDGRLLLAVADPAAGEVLLVDQAAGVRRRSIPADRRITCCQALPGGQLVAGLGTPEPARPPMLIFFGPAGDELWRTDTDICATGPAAHDGDGVLAVAGLRLSSREQPAYVIQALGDEAGDTLWRVPVGPRPPHILIARPPGFLVGVGSELLAVTPQGRIAWRVDAGSWTRGVYPGEEHIYLVVEGPARGDGTSWRIHGLDAQGGRRWHRLVDDPLAAGYSSETGALLLVTAEGLLALTPAGRVEWRVPFPEAGVPQQVRGGGVFAAGDGGGLLLAGPAADGQSLLAAYNWTGPPDGGAPGRRGDGATDNGEP